MHVEGIDLGIGKVVFLEIGDILKQLQTFLCRNFSLSSFLTNREITIIEQEGRNSLRFAAQALLDHVKQRCLRLVAPDVVHLHA